MTALHARDYIVELRRQVRDDHAFISHDSRSASPLNADGGSLGRNPAVGVVVFTCPNLFDVRVEVMQADIVIIGTAAAALRRRFLL
jgi:hypothetical protein